MPKHSKKKFVNQDLQLTSAKGENFGREDEVDERFVTMKEKRRKFFREEDDFVVETRGPKKGIPGPRKPPYMGNHTTIPPYLRIVIDDANDQFSRNRPYPLDYICVILSIFWSSLLIKQTRENAADPNRRKWKRLPAITDSVGVLSLLKLLAIPRGLGRKELVTYFNRYIEDVHVIDHIRQGMPQEYSYLVPHFHKRRTKINAAQKALLAKSALNGHKGSHTGVDDHDPLGCILNWLRKHRCTNTPELLVECEFQFDDGRFHCALSLDNYVGHGSGLSKKVAKNQAAHRLFDELNGANGEYTGLDDVDCTICSRQLTRHSVLRQRKPNNYLFFLSGCRNVCTSNVCIACCAETYVLQLTNHPLQPRGQFCCTNCFQATMLPDDRVLHPYMRNATFANFQQRVQQRGGVRPPVPQHRRPHPPAPLVGPDPGFDNTPVPAGDPSVRPRLHPAVAPANPPPLVPIPVQAIPNMPVGPLINGPAPVVVPPVVVPPGVIVPPVAVPAAPAGAPLAPVMAPVGLPPHPVGVVVPPPAPVAAAVQVAPPAVAARVLLPPMMGRVHTKKNIFDLFLVSPGDYLFTLILIICVVSALYYQRVANVIPLVIGGSLHLIGGLKYGPISGIACTTLISLTQHSIFGEFLKYTLFIVETELLSRTEVVWTFRSLAYVNFLILLFGFWTTYTKVFSSRLGAIQEFNFSMTYGWPYFLSLDLLPVDPSFRGYRNVLFYSDVADAVKASRSSSLDSAGLVRYVEDSIQREVLGVVGLDDTILANTRFMVYQSIVAERLLDQSHITGVIETVSNLKW